MSSVGEVAIDEVLRFGTRDVFEIIKVFGALVFAAGHEDERGEVLVSQLFHGSNELAISLGGQGLAADRPPSANEEQGGTFYDPIGPARFLAQLCFEQFAADRLVHDLETLL